MSPRLSLTAGLFQPAGPGRQAAPSVISAQDNKGDTNLHGDREEKMSASLSGLVLVGSCPRALPSSAPPWVSISGSDHLSCSLLLVRVPGPQLPTCPWGSPLPEVNPEGRRCRLSFLPPFCPQNGTCPAPFTLGHAY